MKRLFFTIPLLLVLIVPQAWAATSSYPNPYRQTMWNNITDGIHTLGQNKYQAIRTKNELHTKRTNARLKSMRQASMAKFKARRRAWQNSQNQ